MSSSVGMILPNIWKNKIHVPNHQPGIDVLKQCITYVWIWRFPKSLGYPQFSSSRHERPELRTKTYGDDWGSPMT